MKVPLEHLMHMPQHILLQKLGEMAKGANRRAEQGKSAEPKEKKE